MTTEIKAIIFDVYETLAYDNADLRIRAFDNICQTQGLLVTGRELWHLWEPLRKKFRHERLSLEDQGQRPPFITYERAWRECFRQVFCRLGTGDAASAARATVSDLAQRPLFPETASTIALLNDARHLQLGVLSNADVDSLWPLVKLHGLEFDGVECSESARAYKPDPRAFQLIAATLDVPPEACLFVGDSQIDDVLGAHSAAMKTVWVNRQGKPPAPDLPAPDYQVGNLKKLMDIPGVYR